ncbi:phenazine biosynthesis PhzC/PhzF protein [Trichoderma citrinoviride]|uniref:Phenazine biosynthesis PhzC/PhzF protein n=1 Tax=Trichoderma citrinoviride TaxID=58853 RepID=A0A2T4BIF0_9HYPO|nr:phenazine biosynthesis PhzC/PhzF protein [Trichoderma citrinoviride]PTB69094.1 phenazine biosynthesis PhzC/PhzF protein [Trichoderma citrinoviride]
MELPFITLDVFTRTRFRGNPLAVVTIPHDIKNKPTQQQKQAIAREFNLSETVFIHGVADPAADPSRRIDIFLTSAEIPFAGHPTIGAAVSLLRPDPAEPSAHHHHPVTELVTKAGRIATLTAHAGIFAADLQPNPDVRRLELDAPVFSLVKGVSFALVELPSLELLAQVAVGPVEFKPHGFLDDGWQEGFIGRFYYVRTGDSTADDDDDGVPVVGLRTRMIAEGFEDPATGAASSCLAAYLSIHGRDKQTTPTRRYDFTQGVEMGKESSVRVDVSLKDGALDTVLLAGPAVQVMRGTITVE